MLNQFFKDEEGQGMTEYILIVCLIAMICFIAVKLFGEKIKALFGQAGEKVQSAGDGWDNP